MSNGETVTVQEAARTEQWVRAAVLGLTVVVFAWITLTWVRWWINIEFVIGLQRALRQAAS